MKNIFVKLLTLLLTASMVMSMMTSCFIEDFLETEAPETSETPQETTLGADTKPNSPDESPKATETNAPNTSAPETSNKTPSATTGNGNHPNNTRPPETDPTWETPAESDPNRQPSETEREPLYVGPTASSKPTSTTEKGNWIFEIEKSKTTLTVDGELDAAYEDGIVLLAERNLPTMRAGYEDNESTLYVYATADDTNIYFFYVFVKDTDPKIFWDENYLSMWHFDCADFVLDLGGAESTGSSYMVGKEFRIMGAIEGPKGTALTHDLADPAAAGVDNWYVKHTDYGYNVEFSIPLKNVTGTDANGDKKISFTAMSTITLGWREEQAQPDRAYTAVSKGSTATNEDKANPNILVIKDTAENEPKPIETPAATTPATFEPEMTPAETSENFSGYVPVEATAPTRTTASGNWVFEIDKTAKTVAVDGMFETDAYASGVCLPSYQNLSPDGSGFNVYLTADDEYIYVFYEFTKCSDPKIFTPKDALINYKYDCVDFVLNRMGEECKGVNGVEFRIFGAVEGGKGIAFAENTDDAGVADYYVKHTEKGYNVEFSIPLSIVAGVGTDANKTISFSALSTVCFGWGEDGTPKRVYTFAKQAVHVSGQHVDNIKAKEAPSLLVVRGTAPEGVTGMSDDGRYIYTLNAASESLLDDPIARWNAYKSGLVYSSKYYEGPAEIVLNGRNYYNMYMTADADNIYVLFDVWDSNIVSNAHDPAVNAGGADGSQRWWNDCTELCWYNDTRTPDYGEDGKLALDQDIRIWAEVEGTNHYTESNEHNNPIINAVNDGFLVSYTVKHNMNGYTVEYVISREKATTDNTFAFMALVTMADVISEGVGNDPDTYGRVYGAIENSAMISRDGAKKYANIVEIVDAN